MKEKKEVEDFIKKFNLKFNNYIDQKREDLMISIKTMNDDFRTSLIKWGQQYVDIMSTNKPKKKSTNKRKYSSLGIDEVHE